MCSAGCSTRGWVAARVVAWSQAVENSEKTARRAHLCSGAFSRSCLRSLPASTASWTAAAGAADTRRVFQGSRAGRQMGARAVLAGRNLFPPYWYWWWWSKRTDTHVAPPSPHKCPSCSAARRNRPLQTVPSSRMHRPCATPRQRCAHIRAALMRSCGWLRCSCEPAGRPGAAPPRPVPLLSRCRRGACSPSP